jgi:hypothetical protein
MILNRCLIKQKRFNYFYSQSTISLKKKPKCSAENPLFVFELISAFLSNNISTIDLFPEYEANRSAV